MDDYSLILLDIDGVLLHARGYRESLRASVGHFGRLMGLDEAARLTDEDIAGFEAHGFTCEWDSLAVCVGMLVLAAVENAPQLVRPTLVETLAAIREDGVRVATPDSTALIREAAALRQGPRPSRFALDLLVERAPAHTHGMLREVMADPYQLDAPTTRVFQHYTLGSARFRETYGIAPELETESLLATMDRPQLDAPTRERLLAAVAAGTQHATIYTARPSLVPVDADGTREVPPLEIVPEAEIAQALVGLETLPLIATGKMAWLAASNGSRAEDYVKPSPVQALAAIGAAASGTEAPALQAALALAERGELTGPLAMLKGRATVVRVFEDSVGGILSTKGAVEKLRAAGLDVRLEAVGVSNEEVKREALRGVAERVVENVNEGLAPVLGS